MKFKIDKLLLILKKLTKEQKKIIGFFLIAVLFLFLFWLLVYNPQKIKSQEIEKDLAWTENQIDEIHRLVEGKDLTEAVSELKLNFLNLANMLPSQDQTVIANLLEAAKKLGVEVKNISPSAKQEIQTNLPGYIVEELPISLKLVTEYKSLGEYINLLRSNFLVLIKINKLDIKGNGEGKYLLDAELKLSAYLSRKK